jgi:hypothetical protein
MGMPFVGGTFCPGSCQMGMPGGGLCPALGRIVGAEVCGCGKIVGIVFDMAYSSGGTGQLFA